jgi:hypothetical protein
MGLLRLRIRDIDLARTEILVRDGKDELRNKPDAGGG